jgi:hypothetical protein
MHPIVGPEDLDSLEEQGTLVGILVAQQLEQAVLGWIFQSWPQLHQQSGMNWHIAIPCEANPKRQGHPGIHEFNFSLSDQLREMYGIDLAEGPVLVLDDFMDEHRQLYLKISHNEVERVRMFNSMTTFINGYVRDPNYRGHNDLGRYQLISALYNHIQGERIFQSFVSLSSNSVSGALRLFRGSL